MITSHPQDVQGQEGCQVILEVKAYGTVPLQYQWHHESKTILGMLNHTMYIPITSCCFTGEKKSFYSIHPVTKSDAGRYYCKVKNKHGVEKSKSAMVTITTSLTALYSATESGVTYPTSLEYRMFQIPDDTPLADAES